MEVLKGAYVKPTKLTVGDLLDDYHARYVAVKYVPRSAQAYRYSIDSRLKPVLGSVVLSSLTWHQIEDFRDGLSADGIFRALGQWLPFLSPSGATSNGRASSTVRLALVDERWIG